MNTVLQDARYALRTLFKTPGFTLVAVLTLALGIGANTAIFSVVNELLLRPRPGIGHPEGLVDIGRSMNGSGFDNFSYPVYLDYRDRNRTLSGVLGYSLEPRAVSLGGDGEAERIYAGLVTGNYFSVLEAKPALGRFFTPEEDSTPGTHPVVVLSNSLWKQRFAGDRSILGREIRINGQPFRVIGVASEQFRGTTVVVPDAWFPVMASPLVIPNSNLVSTARRGSVWMVAMGRLKPGVTLEQARADLSTIARQMEQDFPNDHRGWGAAVYWSSMFPGDLRTIVAAFLSLLMAIVGLVLLIACVNVAGMMLVRASTRRREIAVRVALGAGRGRIVSQLLTEGAVLFLLGGAAGLLLATWMTDLLVTLLPQLPLPVRVDLSLDWRALTFALLLSLAAGVLSALAPALQVSSGDLVTPLKVDASGASHRKLRLRNALVLAQVAMSLLLMIGAGLFLRALQRAGSLHPGFDVNNVQVVSFDLALAGYQQEDGLPFTDRFLERLRALPGVQAVTTARVIPLMGDGLGLGGIAVAGHQAPDGTRYFEADWNVVTPDYFNTLRIPLVSGRTFTDADRQGTQDVAIINETMARRFWPGEDAVGKRFLNGDGGPGDSDDVAMEIVGVARDSKYRSLGDEQRMFVYVPLRQRYMNQLSVLIRTSGGPSVLPGVRSVLRELSPHLPVLSTQTLTEIAGIGLLPQRLAGYVAGSLGLVGLLLTGLGIYGVTAYSVSQRTREIGIRMALGAQREDVLSMVLRQGMKITAVGVAIGLACALAVTHLLSSLLFGVSPLDAVTFFGVAALMTSVALLACWIPARRASRVDPMVALRYE